MEIGIYVNEATTLRFPHPGNGLQLERMGGTPVNLTHEIRVERGVYRIEGPPTARPAPDGKIRVFDDQTVSVAPPPGGKDPYPPDPVEPLVTQIGRNLDEARKKVREFFTSPGRTTPIARNDVAPPG